MILCRLVRFYGLAPDEILALPMWQLAMLQWHLPALAAQEQLERAEAAVLPHVKEGRDRARYMINLRRIATAAYPPPERRRPEVVEQDPEKAREWFARRGIKVA